MDGKYLSSSILSYSNLWCMKFNSKLCLLLFNTLCIPSNFTFDETGIFDVKYVVKCVVNCLATLHFERNVFRRPAVWQKHGTYGRFILCSRKNQIQEDSDDTSVDLILSMFYSDIFWAIWTFLL